MDKWSIRWACPSALAVLLVLAILLPAAPTRATDGLGGDVVEVVLDNGMTAVLYSADHLLGMVEGGVLDLGNGRRLELITDISDPAVTNKGDGSFHPFTVDQVLSVLGSITYPDLRLKVKFYLLPYPRRSSLASSTSGGEVFLSPQVREVSDVAAAYVVTHEVGHAFQWRYLPWEHEFGWSAYARLRGLSGDDGFSESSSHAFRPSEVFAEDFRVLFGGEAARLSGRIENPLLPPPEEVAGLKDFFLSLPAGLPGRPAIVSLSNYPNPFNPATEIRLVLAEEALAAGAELAVRIYDLRGALVKEIYRGAVVRRELTFQWDGTDRSGRPVASSTYFCLATYGRYKQSRKLLLVK